MSSRRTAIGIFSVAVFASPACTLLVDTSDLDHPKASSSPDSGSDSASLTPNDAAVVDAAAESGVDACVPAAPLVPFGSLFTARGKAKALGSKTELTSGAIDDKGAIWRNDVVRFEDFDMTAGFEIFDPNGDGSVADGMTFAWIEGQAVPDLGDGGGSLGVQGLHGWAVAIDTFTENEDPPVIAVVNPIVNSAANEWRITKASAPASFTLLGSEHSLRVRLEKGGIVTVWLDGKVTIDKFTIPGFSPFEGHWGFTAASGDVTSTQRITAVSFVPSSKACP